MTKPFGVVVYSYILDDDPGDMDSNSPVERRAIVVFTFPTSPLTALEFDFAKDPE